MLDQCSHMAVGLRDVLVGLYQAEQRIDTS